MIQCVNLSSLLWNKFDITPSLMGLERTLQAKRINDDVDGDPIIDGDPIDGDMIAGDPIDGDPSMVILSMVILSK